MKVLHLTFIEQRILAVLIMLTPGRQLSSLTLKKPLSTSRYYPFWMWRHVGIGHWSCLCEPTDYESSRVSGSRIQNTVTSSHSSQHRMNGRLSRTWWRLWGHSDTAPCGCPRGSSHIASHCHSLQWHAWSYGRRYESLSTEVYSMEGRLVLYSEHSATEAVQLLCWSDSNDG